MPQTPGDGLPALFRFAYVGTECPCQRHAGGFRAISSRREPTPGMRLDWGTSWSRSPRARHSAVCSSRSPCSPRSSRLLPPARAAAGLWTVGTGGDRCDPDHRRLRRQPRWRSAALSPRSSSASPPSRRSAASSPASSCRAPAPSDRLQVPNSVLISLVVVPLREPPKVDFRARFSAGSARRRALHAGAREKRLTASSGSVKTSPRTNRPSRRRQIQATGMSRMPSSRLRT